MSVTVCGHLACDAFAGISGVDRAAVVILSIDSGRGGLPFEVRHVVGATPEAHINAQRLAAAMRRGAEARAGAEFVEYCSDHGAARIVMRSPFAIRVGDWEML